MKQKHLIYIVLSSLILLAFVLGTVSAIELELGEKKPKPSPEVGVIEINQSILLGKDREYVNNMIEYARKNENIKSVVLKINCPGGYATGIEDIYYNLLSLKEEKPVVTSIVGMSASGGYYISVASDYIYAPPSAYIGNIGVKSISPPYPPTSENLVETGPSKRTGTSVMKYPKTVQTIFQSFLNSVENHRGEKLTIPIKKIKTGLLFTGKKAAEYGLIDETGSTQEAIQKSADLAGLEKYKIVKVGGMVEGPNWWKEGVVRVSAPTDENIEYKEFSELTLSDLKNIAPQKRYYFLYCPSLKTEKKEFDMAGENIPGIENKPSTSENVVLLDYSHNNAFAPKELNFLLSKITNRNFTMRYFDERSDLDDKISKSDSFLVINPRRPFTEDEIDTVENFIRHGGRLVLINDPSRASPNSINSLATNFSHTFAEGYLYSLEEYYGIYKNIYLDQFENRKVSEGLEKLVFFTSTNILSENGGIAKASEGLYNSRGEIKSNFSPIVTFKNENIISIGDLTFIKRPYNNFENNSQFISNIAKFLTHERKKIEPSPQFELTNLKIDPDKAKSGENIRITVNVKNIGEVAGTKTITLKVNDKIVDKKEVNLAPNESTMVSFEIVRETSGTYKVEVDGLSDSFEIIDSNEKEFKKYRNENYRFTFSYPDNWSIENSSLENQISIRIYPPREIQERRTGTITAGKLNIKLENVKEQLEEYRNTLENSYSKEEIIRLTGPKEIERNQIPGVEFQYLIETLGYERILFFEGEKYEYNLIVHSKMEVYENIRKSLENITDSFRPY